jgi:nitrite reductase/ring-hydroxylating ferredoxin subunit
MAVLIPIKDVVAIELKQTDGEDGLQLLSCSVAQWLVSGDDFAIQNICPCAMVSLDDASRQACTITCLWQGFQLNVLNGQCESWREREPLNRFHVEVRDGH